MTSQLHNNFQASQAMQGVDDVTTLFFRAIRIGRPQVDTEGWSAQLYSINLGLRQVATIHVRSD